MRNPFAGLMISLGAVLLLPTVVLSQNARFDPHDLTGIWSRVTRDGGAACRDCGDRGYSLDVPPLTPEGQRMFDANKPSYGREGGSAAAAAHPEEPLGRRRAVPPVKGNDPTGTCNPSGPTRMLLYIEPVEILQLPDRILQHFEWTNQWREIWTDGRQAPKEPDLPRWYGYSVAKWEGDTFTITTTGVDDRTWVDQFGYPHSFDMQLTETYKRVSPTRIEFTMTINDPKIYTKPWVSEKKAMLLQDKTKLNLAADGWQGLLDQTCAPLDEVDSFNKRVRDPAAQAR